MHEVSIHHNWILTCNILLFSMAFSKYEAGTKELAGVGAKQNNTL